MITKNREGNIVSKIEKKIESEPTLLVQQTMHRIRRNESEESAAWILIMSCLGDSSEGMQYLFRQHLLSFYL